MPDAPIKGNRFVRVRIEITLRLSRVVSRRLGDRYVRISTPG